MNRDDIDFGVVSHVGMVRSENQDYHGINEPASDQDFYRKGRLIVVCDGMGGHNGGTIASRTTVERVLDTFQKVNGAPKEVLLKALERANEALKELGENEPALRNMGTTFVGCIVRGRQLYVAHVGDSRAYLFREGQVEQITRDHTYLNDLVDIGLLTPEKVANHPDRNIITRCVGMGASIQVDFNFRELKPGDAILFCSDGLYNHVADDEMLDAIQRLEAQSASQALTDLANERGGEDNITVSIAKFLAIPEGFDAVQANEEDEGRSTTEATPVVEIDVDAQRRKSRVSGPSTTIQEIPRRGVPPLYLAILIAVELIVLVVLQVLIRQH